VIDEIGPNRRVRISTEHKCQFEFGANSVRAGNQIPITIVIKSVKASEVTNRAGCSCPRKCRLDLLPNAIKRGSCGININAGRRIIECALLSLCRHRAVLPVPVIGPGQPNFIMDAPLNGHQKWRRRSARSMQLTIPTDREPEHNGTRSRSLVPDESPMLR
jgi:hypothetical protein